jgi:hypothetical protein
MKHKHPAGQSTIAIPAIQKIPDAIAILADEGFLPEAYLAITKCGKTDPISHEQIRIAVEGYICLTNYTNAQGFIFKKVIVKCGEFSDSKL